MFLARGRSQSAQPTTPADEGEMKIIELKSDLSGPIAPGDSAIFLVGNFAAQHNGAVITCDSAVRYSSKHIVFFGNVLINKNTTYIYGDRADYDGELNEARVYSDLIKVVDGDATLYTYRFIFNTKDNIGQFGDGGVMINRDSRLESIRGFYYANTKELISVDQVEMRNDEYQLRGDSVVYNMESDNAQFFDRTNIWNKDGDYLYADRGAYHKADSLYLVTRNGYVLTDKQEMWSDSIDYHRAANHVVLRRDIQIDDTEHKVLAFGEYGEYWKEPGNAFLTRRPSVVSYDLSQGDSLFMRADSMFLYTIFRRDEQQGAATDSLTRTTADSTALSPADSTQRAMSGAAALAALNTLGADSLTAHRPPTEAAQYDSLTTADSLAASPVDSLRDSTAMANAADTVQLTANERKAQLKEAAKKAAAEKRIAAQKADKEELDAIAARRKEKATAKLKAEAEREEARLTARRLKIESKLRARQARAARKGKTLAVDSTALQQIDSLIDKNTAQQDSLFNLQADSLHTDSLAVQADSLDSLAVPLDSMYRLVKGYRNVKIYRSDFQSVSDSLVAISTDSTIHLYIKPVLWNENNQITSKVMDIFTKNQQIVRAEFVGSPMMVSLLDTLHYNQVAGKTMVAFFHDNAIYRNDVNGNAETIYYMQDGEPPEITGMGVIKSGEISFYIEEKQISQITYRNNPIYNIYPMNKIPETQEPFLKDFHWEGKRRPTQAEVFDRQIRPSIRTAKSALRRPDFPVLQRIERHKKQLIEERRWFDRNEHIDAATEEWMLSLGFEVGKPREK
ncbi:MAG: OstA-like protein [Alistipes sp.]